MELPLSDPVVAVNVADVAPAATVAVAGTVTTVLLLERVTAAPPVGAAWDREIVQVVEEFADREEGAHESDDRETGATNAIAYVEELPL